MRMVIGTRNGYPSFCVILKLTVDSSSLTMWIISPMRSSTPAKSSFWTLMKALFVDY